MRFEEEGVLLSHKPLGERTLIATFFSKSHGILKGALTATKPLKPFLAPGSRHKIVWQGRLEDHLGRLQLDPLYSPLSDVLGDPFALHLLTALTSLLESTLPEREPHDMLYAPLGVVLDNLNSPIALTLYCQLECLLVRAFGIPMEFTRCAVTGDTQDLKYVSPKSGRAVSSEAAQGYEDRLIPLPAFLNHLGGFEEVPGLDEILAGLRLSGYFLNRYVLTPQGRTLPPARQRLCDFVERAYHALK